MKAKCWKPQLGETYEDADDVDYPKAYDPRGIAETYVRHYYAHQEYPNKVEVAVETDEDGERTISAWIVEVECFPVFTATRKVKP
jgi:hypothetical protein